MARFPKIQSPCPVKNRLSDVMDGDTCRQCERQVHDLDAMNTRQRRAFLSDRKGEVCVSYSLPRKMGVTAVIAAAAVGGLSAQAQDVTPVDEPLLCPENNALSAEEVIIMVGGIKEMSTLEYVDTYDDDADLPTLSVVYEALDDEPQ